MSRNSFGSLHAAAAVVAAAAILELTSTHVLSGLEGRLSDAFVRRHAEHLAPDPDIVIVAIDEASLAKMQGEAGKWPWPRAVHADLVLGIEAQKPRAVVFDLLFSEEDAYNRDSDRRFNDAIKGRGNIYLPMQRLNPAGDANGVPIETVAAILDLRPTASAQRGARIQLLPPQAVDEDNWRRSGIINFNEDADGVGRRYWLAMPAYGWRLPSLPARDR